MNGTTWERVMMQELGVLQGTLMELERLLDTGLRHRHLSPVLYRHLREQGMRLEQERRLLERLWKSRNPPAETAP